MNTGNRMQIATYIIVKRNLKWYVKLWNIITFHKELNYEYKLLGTGIEVGVK